MFGNFEDHVEGVLPGVRMQKKGLSTSPSAPAASSLGGRIRAAAGRIAGGVRRLAGRVFGRR